MTPGEPRALDGGQDDGGDERLVVDFGAPSTPQHFGEPLVVSLDSSPPQVPPTQGHWSPPDVAPGQVATPPPAPVAKRKRGGAIRAAMVIVPVVLIAAVGWLALQAGWLTGDGGLADPASVALPEIEDREETAAYLESTGAPLLEMSAIAAEILDADGPDALTAVCRRAMAEDLPAQGEPMELAVIAGEVPDESTSDILLSELGALMVAISTCTDDSNAADLTELQFQHTVVERRLAELGLT